MSNLNKHAKTKLSHHTPLEIQLEIMKRVPVKSVVRFRSVSKQWKSLIDTAKFIVDHTVRDTHRQPLLLIRYKDSEEYKQCFISLVDNDRFPEQKLSLNVPESVKSINDPIILGGSHGLLCFYDSPPASQTETLVLWNPTIRKSVTIDVPNVLLDSLYGTSVGFGVCPITCDPKIVKINYISTLKEIERVSCIPWQVQVFTLSSRAWRSPRKNVPRKSIGFTLSQVVIDGFIYWLACDRVNTDAAGVRSDNLIVSFDLTSDEFKEICLPKSLTFQDQHLLYISKLKESLVVLEYYKDTLQPVCAVWKTMERGFPRSFSKMFIVNVPDTSLLNFVHGFRKNGQPIMDTVPHSRASYSLELEMVYDEEVTSSLEVYEPSSKRINDLGIYGVDGSFALRSYTETLLLLDQSESNII